MTYYTYTVKWPSINPDEIKSIQITGNFDNWSRSLPTQTIDEIKSNDYNYIQKIKLSTKEKLVFKFIVNDSNWITNHNFKIEHDSSGVENNVIEANELIEFHEFEQAAAEPESVPAIVAPILTTSAATKEIEPEEEEEEEPTHITEKDLPIESPVVVGSNVDDDNIMSDIETKSSPTLKSQAQTNNLTQVLTSSSSFAAVSIPSNYDSTHDYENVNKDIDPVTDDFSTPTNSVLNSTVLSEKNTAAPSVNKPNLLAINSESTLSNTSNVPLPSSGTAATSTNDEEHEHDDVVEILKAPGGYPTTPELSNSNPPTPTKATSSNSEKGRRGENLISRFKSLFRY
ncbi:hypothetical protein DFJ63DRAFT_310569 [Scheffersomyces coipomensis]|uniref:uncharacterized protein n=1 Tax=Scheffersomyces coipomensis TaxID=1788519 RepID=UPI00315DD8CF